MCCGGYNVYESGERKWEAGTSDSEEGLAHEWGCMHGAKERERLMVTRNR